jgi:hypothetical protein
MAAFVATGWPAAALALAIIGGPAPARCSGIVFAMRSLASIDFGPPMVSFLQDAGPV